MLIYHTFPTVSYLINTFNTLLPRLPIHPSVDYFSGVHCFEAQASQGVDYFFEVLIIF